MPDLESDLFVFLSRKYVQRADARQKAIGIQYMEAETRDLAQSIARFLAYRAQMKAQSDGLTRAVAAAARVTVIHAGTRVDAYAPDGVRTIGKIPGAALIGRPAELAEGQAAAQGCIEIRTAAGPVMVKADAVKTSAPLVRPARRNTPDGGAARSASPEAPASGTLDTPDGTGPTPGF